MKAIEYIKEIINQIEESGRDDRALESSWYEYSESNSEHIHGNQMMDTKDRGTFCFQLKDNELIIESKTPIIFKYINNELAIFNKKINSILYTKDLELNHVAKRESIFIDGVAFPLFIYTFKCNTINTELSPNESFLPNYINEALADFKNNTSYTSLSYENIFFKHSVLQKDGDTNLTITSSEFLKLVKKDNTCKYTLPINNLEYFKAVLKILESID